MAWKKWRGTPERGCWHAYWKEQDGDRERTRSKALSRHEPTAQRMLEEVQRNLDLQGVGIGTVVAFSVLRQKYLAHLKAKNSAPAYIERVRIVLFHVERLFPGLKLPALTADKVDDYQAARLAEAVDANTVRREVGIIKTAVKKGRRWKYQVPDLSTVEKPLGVEPVHLPYTLDQVLDFLAKAPALLATVLRLGLYAGLRRMEILALKWEHILWEESAILLGKGWRTKNRQARAVPMHAQLAAALAAWRRHPEAQGSEYVVPWNASPSALTHRVIYYLRVKCKIPEGAVHTLRRTFLTQLKKKDVDTGKMMRAAGQKTERVTQGYVKLDVSDLQEGVGRLAYEPKVEPAP